MDKNLLFTICSFAEIVLYVKLLKSIDVVTSEVEWKLLAIRIVP